MRSSRFRRSRGAGDPVQREPDPTPLVRLRKPRSGTDQTHPCGPGRHGERRVPRGGQRCAVRDYLSIDTVNSPDRTLTCTVPVSVRSPEEMHDWGNRLATWQVSLATDVDDPVERLHTISRVTNACRGDSRRTRPGTPERLDGVVARSFAPTANGFPGSFRSSPAVPLSI